MATVAINERARPSAIACGSESAKPCEYSSPVSTASPIERRQTARLGFALHRASVVAVVVSEKLTG